MKSTITYALLFLIILNITIFAAPPLRLEEAVATAISNSKLKKISDHDRQIAQAKHQQAMSASYPIIDASIVGNIADDVFLDNTKSTFTAPVIGEMQIDYDHIIMGENTVYGQLDITYPLYTGGKISALQQQAALGVAISQESTKQTLSDIVFDVTKYYYSVLLSQHLLELTEETLERMRAILYLTEAFYKGGSLSVKKTDYLRIKMVNAMVASMVEEMKNNKELALLALKFAMGTPHRHISIAESLDTNSISLEDDFEYFLTQLHRHNHQLIQTQLAVDVMESKIDEARSGYLPHIALYANAKHLYNNYDGGIINDTNENSTNIGLALTYNLFHGGLTDANVYEAKHQKMKLTLQKQYLDEALELQLQEAFSTAHRSIKQVSILGDAVTTAAQNSDLNFRAYQEDLVTTKDVIEAQIFESMTKANYYRAYYDALINRMKLSHLIGQQ